MAGGARVGHELHRFRYRSPNEWRAYIREHDDGGQPQVPPMRVSQVIIEPVVWLNKGTQKRSGPELRNGPCGRVSRQACLIRNLQKPTLGGIVAEPAHVDGERLLRIVRYIDHQELAVIYCR